MVRVDIRCEACGANEFTKKNEYYMCEFCGSKYAIDQNNSNNNDNGVNSENDGKSTPSKILTDAKITSLYLKANEYMTKGNYTEELNVLSEALLLDPENSITLVKIGRCYRALGMYEKAIETYKQAIEIDPENGTAYTNMGTIYCLRKNWNEASIQYNRGLPHIDKSTDDYWTAYANHAIVVAKLGNVAKAEKMIKEAESHGYKNGDGCREMAGIPKKGCYVATCVYNSYDCPQVWTLRRFRDYTLAKNILGRAFIKFYYKVSPTLVKCFGGKKWFRYICKRVLDIFVIKLQANGYQSTKYYD